AATAESCCRRPRAAAPRAAPPPASRTGLAGGACKLPAHLLRGGAADDAAPRDRPGGRQLTDERGIEARRVAPRGGVVEGAERGAGGEAVAHEPADHLVRAPERHAAL